MEKFCRGKIEQSSEIVKPRGQFFQLSVPYRAGQWGPHSAKPGQSQAHFHRPCPCPRPEDREKQTCQPPAQNQSQKTRVPGAVTWCPPPPTRPWWGRNVRPFSSRVLLTVREATSIPRSQLNGNSSASASNPRLLVCSAWMGMSETQGTLSASAWTLGLGRSQPLLLAPPPNPQPFPQLG